MPVSQSIFGHTPDGREVREFTLVNAHGLAAQILTYGGTVRTLRVPDRRGTMGDVVLGFETLAPYLGPHPYFGSLVGRYANRMAGGRFELDGVEYSLARNNGPNHLHGGPEGFHRRVWDALERPDAGGPSVQLTYLSLDGEEGYPGNLSVSVVYTLADDDALQIDYAATTDRDTIVNLTNHSYFNLAGGGEVLDHVLMLAAGRFLPVDPALIPTGEMRPVGGTPMDFTVSRRIGDRIADDDEQLGYGQGYDHNWVLDGPAGEIRLAATLSESTTGRTMEVWTTQPGVQFYAGNLLDGSLIGKDGQVYPKNGGLCLETQHFPDSPNRPDFPSTALRPGERYRQTTVYRFRVEPA